MRLACESGYTHMLGRMRLAQCRFLEGREGWVLVRYLSCCHGEISVVQTTVVFALTLPKVGTDR